MTLGSKENYIHAAATKRGGGGGWASTGIDRRRGLPNNHLWDPTGIPDIPPQLHLNNDAGKLSRLMVATHKCKEILDMEANGRKATWFSM
jgi:hypothetical protein